MGGCPSDCPQSDRRIIGSPPKGSFLPFSEIDAAAVSRVLCQIADRPDDLADAYFERLEEIELPPEGAEPGIRVRRESGLAIRMLREGRTWLAGRDGVDSDRFTEAVRRVARAMPSTPYPQPRLGRDSWTEPPAAPEVQEMPALFQRALRSHHTDIGTVPITVRRHRRWVRVVGSHLASSTEHEQFYSVAVHLPGTSYGGLFETVDQAIAEQIASSVVRIHAARDSEPPERGVQTCILGPAATAVLLHEAVAHALEADILARGGHPEAAIGVQMASTSLSVFDDPAAGPKGVRRRADDEGHPTSRRCLLRNGVVEQPICDGAWARKSDLLLAGAGRRGDRHDAPGPRSSHLELIPGDATTTDLLANADGGLYLPEAERGHLDPMTGELTLHFPYGRRIHDGTPGTAVGPCAIHCHVTDLLTRIEAVGREARSGGAGWCAKNGILMPVWATAPDIRVDGVEIYP